MKQINTLTLRHQNFMRAVRREMGWPSFRPANDCICFCSGQPIDFEVGSEVARIAQQVGKDAIYTGWANASAKTPTSFAIVFRELLTVDLIDRVVPFAADEEAPLIFLSTRADESFVVGRRGSLARVPGKPKNIGKGRKLAMKRIKATAAGMDDRMLENNRSVAPGAQWIEPEAPVETVVRFS